MMKWLVLLICVACTVQAIAQPKGQQKELSSNEVDAEWPKCKTHRIRCLKSEKHCETRHKCLKTTKKEKCFLKKGSCKVKGKRPRKDCSMQCVKTAEKDGTYKVCVKKTPLWTEKAGRQCLRRETRYYDLKGCEYTGEEPHRELSCEESKAFSKCVRWSKAGKRTVKSYKCTKYTKRQLSKGDCVTEKYKCTIPDPSVLYPVCLRRAPTHRSCYETAGCAKWDKEHKKCWKACKVYKYKQICTDKTGKIVSTKLFEKAHHGSQKSFANTKEQAIADAKRREEKAKTQKKDTKQEQKKSEKTSVGLKSNQKKTESKTKKAAPKKKAPSKKAPSKKAPSKKGSTKGGKVDEKNFSEISFESFNLKSKKGKAFWAVWLKCQKKFKKCVKELPQDKPLYVREKMCQRKTADHEVCTYAESLKQQRVCAYRKFKCLAYGRRGMHNKEKVWCKKARGPDCCARAHPSDFCMNKKGKK